MQALRPLGHHDTWGLQLSSPCPGRTPRRPDLGRERTASCRSHPACPSPLLRPAARHRGSTAGRRDGCLALTEPPARERCVPRRALTDSAAGCFCPDLPTPLPLPQLLPSGRVV